jgi:hypothetical protein
MALDKPVLNQQLNAAYTQAWNTFIAVLENNATSANPVEKPQPVAISQAAAVFANRVADAIDDYIKSAEIVIPQGIKVEVNANSTAPESSPSPTPPASGAAASGAAASAAILTASDIASQINSAEYSGTSTEDSPKAKIS